MNKGLPVPDKQYRWGNWRALIYNQNHTVILLRSDGKTLIVKQTTESVDRVPEYIKDRLWRIGFLGQWRDEQVRRTAIRLKELANQHERFLRTEQLKRG